MSGEQTAEDALKGKLVEGDTQWATAFVRTIKQLHEEEAVAILVKLFAEKRREGRLEQLFIESQRKWYQVYPNIQLDERK